MARGKLDIINQALIELGDNPITSLETDTGAGAKAARSSYDRVINSLFTVDGYKFRFAVKQSKLPQLQNPPMDADNGGYKYAYELPSDYLTLVNLQTSHEYQIYGNQLRCDDKELILDYIARVDESLWPPTFETMAVYAVAIALCKAVTDDSTLKGELSMQLQEAKRIAKLTDSKAVPNKPLGPSLLLMAHRGGMRGSRGYGR